MFIQGDLQAVFDALYSVGAIDPVLKADWNAISNEMLAHQNKFNTAVTAINHCGGDRVALVQTLHSLDPQSINFIALEVAREFAEFQDRKDLQ